MKQYNISQIEVRPQYELIRASPKMYIGGNFDSDGLHYLILQIAEDAINPTHANNSSTLKISILNSTTIEITDSGRGIPVEASQFGVMAPIPRFERVLTTFWRTRFDQAYYQEFGFLDYFGAVLSATAANLHVKTIVQGTAYSINLAKGLITEPLKNLGQTAEVGTRITYTPDLELFGEIEIDRTIIVEGLQKLSQKYPEKAFIYWDSKSDTNLNFKLHS